jgi:hypothetical protein
MVLKKQKEIFDGIWRSFPVQLLFLHFKKNQFLMLLWLGLFGVTSMQVGRVLGIPYLFLDPEYLGEVNFISMMILGAAFGAFAMSFNITSYILDSHKFNFLGPIKRPFAHFCFNNSFIPLVFLLYYSYSFWKFQSTHFIEGNPPPLIFGDLSGFYFGTALTIFLIFLYFFTTNKDYIRHFVHSLDQNLKRASLSRLNILSRLYGARQWKKIHISTYLSLKPFVKTVKPNPRVNREAIIRVFDQNQFNALALELLALISILILGYYRDNPVFQIPAAASVYLLGSLIIMFIGAFSYWLRGWAISFLLLLIISVNSLYKEGMFQKENIAIGLDYNRAPASYSLKKLNSLSTDSLFQSDFDSTLLILNNWRRKFPDSVNPKIIFIGTSGGGQRSAVWAMNVLQRIDSATRGEAFRHSILITGASGGMIGAAYYRELKRRKLNGLSIDPTAHQYLENIAKDNLNPIILSMTVSDLFLRFPRFNESLDTKIYRDRGYAFEDQLMKNTEFVMDRSIYGYAPEEKLGTIPIILLGPTIVNDGRKLFISGQPISYMNRGIPEVEKNINTHVKAIEYSRFFINHQADKLKFITALRMNATFPYITPNISLPSDPPMLIMDAGLSDNLGTIDATRFIWVFKDWIEKNTSGVIILKLRDNEKIREIESMKFPSLFSKFLNPISGLYTMWGEAQEMNNDTHLEYLVRSIKSKVDVIDFEYDPKFHIDHFGNKGNEKWERASLSWHLTKTEKSSIYEAINTPKNIRGVKKLKNLLSIPTRAASN